jgi:AcrR family transcriptional regulator
MKTARATTGETTATAEAGRPSAKTDGRAERSLSTRRRIVEALAALIHEGDLTPTAEAVARRAQVGLRTVFRHFEDMDTLYREIRIDLDTLLQPLLQARLDGPTWRERVLQSIVHRAGIFERLAALHVAAQVHRHESAFLSQDLMESARLQREFLQRLLPAEVAADTPLLDALDLALSIESWIRLRREQGLSERQACRVVRLTVEALLASAPA